MKFITLETDQRQLAFMLSPMLEGSRRWLQDGSFRFEDTHYNRDRARSLGWVPPAVLETYSDDSWFEVDDPIYVDYDPPTTFTQDDGTIVEITNYAHQDEVFEKFKNLKSRDGKYIGALFAEMGTGKTKSAIDLINWHYCHGRIDAVVVLAKKGVHRQWVEDETEDGAVVRAHPVRMFTQKTIPTRTYAWDGKKVPDHMLTHFDGLKWFTMNFDAAIHKRGSEALDAFISEHRGKVAFIGDETHYLKSPTAKRTKAALRAATQASVAFIMTGTPIAKNLVDEFSQLKVLDDSILGHKYMTTFRNEYCVMGGFEGKQIVGSKNLDKFKAITAPFVFRVKKEDCLDLEPKQYFMIPFELSKEQKQAIAELRQTETYVTSSGDVAIFEGAAVVLGKIQEISNGFLQHPEGLEAFPNPRMDALLSKLEDFDGKAIIWARYQRDILALKAALGDEAVCYYGPTSDADRKEAKSRFQDPNSGVRWFLATTGAAAEGLDGMQKVCSTSIYYSNGFNSVQRWQSEDRIHRIGQEGSAVYLDMVAKGCVDYSVLRNLKAKKDFSTLVLDVARNFGMEI